MKLIRHKDSTGDTAKKTVRPGHPLAEAFALSDDKEHAMLFKLTQLGPTEYRARGPHLLGPIFITRSHGGGAGWLRLDALQSAKRIIGRT